MKDALITDGDALIVFKVILADSHFVVISRKAWWYQSLDIKEKLNKQT